MENPTLAEPGEVRCAECGTALAEGQDRETTDNGVFCRPCFNNLTAQLQQVLEDQGREVGMIEADHAALQLVEMDALGARSVLDL